jgi:hypothetical protein
LQTSTGIYFIYALKDAKVFHAVAKMVSQISWLPEKTIFDRSKYKQRMRVQWVGRYVAAMIDEAAVLFYPEL